MENRDLLIKEIERLKLENNELKGKPSVELARRNTGGLKDVLFQQLDNVLSSEPDYKKANAVSKTVKTIIDVAKTELEYARFNNEIRKSKNEDLQHIKSIQMR